VKTNRIIGFLALAKLFATWDYFKFILNHGFLLERNRINNAYH